jgi:hypothetical protein
MNANEVPSGATVRRKKMLRSSSGKNSRGSQASPSAPMTSAAASVPKARGQNRATNATLAPNTRSWAL